MLRAKLAMVQVGRAGLGSSGGCPRLRRSVPDRIELMGTKRVR